MEHGVQQSAKGYGLLASGSSRRWEVTVDESLDHENEWSVELDGPNVYLVFQLKDLRPLVEAVEFLERGCDPKTSKAAASQAHPLGQFGSASVLLIWDNEEAPRCFLVVGPRSRSTMRLTLQADDIQALLQALREAVQDLPDLARK
jgi:hypothetical protein